MLFVCYDVFNRVSKPNNIIHINIFILKVNSDLILFAIFLNGILLLLIIIIDYIQLILKNTLANMHVCNRLKSSKCLLKRKIEKNLYIRHLLRSVKMTFFLSILTAKRTNTKSYFIYYYYF